MFLKPTLLFISGLICSFSFAPLFFIPSIITLSVLCGYLALSKNWKEAFKYGYLYGFGFFLGALYWISFAMQIFIEDFWWAIPFALFGLPLFMAIFVGLSCLAAWTFRATPYYHFIFCIIWLFMEWVISWIFTGLPWAMLGYALTISDIFIQSASVFSIFGLSFITVYIGSSLYNLITKDHTDFKVRFLTCIIIILVTTFYGFYRLNKYKTSFSNIIVRIVQPSITQYAKWNPEIFWDNLGLQIEMSKLPGNPDIIVWSEAALTAPYYYKPVKTKLMDVFLSKAEVLISGGVSDNGKDNNEIEIYSSLIALNKNENVLFDYHKSHLVPFGEYIPFHSILSIKKITHGLIEYTQGKREFVYLKPYNLKILPLICYESIFPFEIITSNKEVDLIINVTNDAWYGNSFGPYQHFEISRIRAVENGLPMLRSGNNGISAIIDPLGRIIQKLDLNKIGTIDSYIPQKITSPTLFSLYKHITILILLILVLALQEILKIIKRFNLPLVKKP